MDSPALQTCKALEWYGEIPEWLFNHASELTFEEFEECLDYYYSERTWNLNCD